MAPSADPPAVTRIDIDARDGVRARLDSAQIAVRRLHAPPGVVRVGLIAGQALLLAGDRVRIEVRVAGPVVVELVEPAGTVAYDMRGGAASWEVDVELSAGARLSWWAMPFVLSSGSRVRRGFTARLAEGTRLAWREQHTWGRTGQDGGDLDARTRVDYAGLPAIVEDLLLDAATRDGWAGLRGARHLDVLTTVGSRLADPAALQYAAPASTLRWWGDRAHLSPIPAALDAARDTAPDAVPG